MSEFIDKLYFSDVRPRPYKNCSCVEKTLKALTRLQYRSKHIRIFEKILLMTN